MTHRIATALLFCLPLAASSAIAAPSACQVDRTTLLALDEQAFDQDLSGGWRALSERPGCEEAAADLIRDYRIANKNDAGLLLWHEGQMRAIAGQPGQAIAVMERARSPRPEQADWNLYVDATIAFLRRDRAALEAARTRLAAVPPPVGKNVPPVVDGFMEVEMDGRMTKMRWPPNIDVVDGLVNCFDKPYTEAYGSACR